LCNANTPAGASLLLAHGLHQSCVAGCAVCAVCCVLVLVLCVLSGFPVGSRVPPKHGSAGRYQRWAPRSQRSAAVQQCSSAASYILVTATLILLPQPLPATLRCWPPPHSACTSHVYCRSPHAPCARSNHRASHSQLLLQNIGFRWLKRRKVQPVSSGWHTDATDDPADHLPVLGSTYPQPSTLDPLRPTSAP
jgi:hypothetical protein